jgi:general secretion pathway protein L
MAETLLIRLATENRGFRDWVLVDEQGVARSPVQTGVPDAGIIAGATRVVVLVPGTEVFIGDARVPGRNRQRVLRAVPYALEEKLADDVESMHFALGPVQNIDHYPVVAVERAKMDAWGALLREQGISATQWLPDVLALPAAEEGWSVLVDADSVLVRNGEYAGFVVDMESFYTLFSLFHAREQAPQRARVLGSTVLDLQDVETEFVDQRQQALEVLAQGWAQGPVINLLQGPYSRSQEWGRLLRPWRASAALLLVGLLVSGVTTGVDYYRLSREQAQLRTDIEAAYRKAFPQAKRIVDPRRQMEQQLSQLQRSAGGGNTDFLFMLAETAGVLRATQGINIQGASYRDGRLDLDLQADNLQILDQLKQSLAASGRMQAEIQSATTEAGQKVKSRIRVQGVGT